MTAQVKKLHTLELSDAELLCRLLEACEAQGDFIDAKRYRNEHIENRLTFERLAREGYILLERVEEQECYHVSLTAIVQLDQSEAARRILDVAERLWSAFQEHYRVALEEPVTLKHLSEVLEVDLPLLSLVHTYMRECSHTPFCFTPTDSVYRAVTVREEVRHYVSFAACVDEMRVWQADRIRASRAGMRGWAQLDVSSERQSLSPQHLVSVPDWVAKVPPHAQALMQEIYASVGDQLLALPTMGIRAVIDVVSLDVLGEDAGTFEEKLRRLADIQHITAKQHDALSAVVDAGNAAAHRGFMPTANQVSDMLSALGVLLQSIYVLGDSTQRLREATPPKPKRTKR
jgi:hypothetical protein